MMWGVYGSPVGDMMGVSGHPIGCVLGSTIVDVWGMSDVGVVGTILRIVVWGETVVSNMGMSDVGGVGHKVTLLGFARGAPYDVGDV